MNQNGLQSKWERTADYLDVWVGPSDMDYAIYRFPNTERGRKRAEEYRDNFNADLRRAMGVTDADLELERPDHFARPEEYERAERVERYYDHAARIVPERAIPVIGDDDPLPTDYPHDYQEDPGE